MKIGSTRDLEGLKPVLRDSGESGPDPVYWVFSEISENDKWANITVIAPGSFGGEYPKTFGHYNGPQINETYKVIEGEGVLLLQKRKLIDGQAVDGKIEEVLLIKAKPGEEIVITPEWGHSWSNVGEYPLLTFDTWRQSHSPDEYQHVEKLQGMAYYLVFEGQEVKPVPNPNYEDLPEPVWISAEEFGEKTDR